MSEVLIFAATEAMLRHDHAAAKSSRVGVQGDERLTLVCHQKWPGTREATLVQGLRDIRPGQRADSLFDALETPERERLQDDSIPFAQ
jgi:hypothetical protein